MHYSDNVEQPASGLTDRPVYDSITTIVNNTGDTIELGKPFSVKAIVTSNGTVVDTQFERVSPTEILEA